MDVFRRVYKEKNRDRAPEQFWIGASVHCSAVAEGLRVINYEAILREAAHAFEWMCAFATKMNSLPQEDVFSCTDNLSSMVAIKYPSVCGHCEHKPCSCNSVAVEREVDKSGRYDRLREKWRHIDHTSYTLSDWQETFRDIYSHNTQLLTPSALGFHFLEEMGEVHSAIRLLAELRSVPRNGLVDPAFVTQLSSIETLVDACIEYSSVVIGHEKVEITSRNEEDLRKRLTNAKIHVITEIADTFAWLCSILNKLADIAKTNGLNLPSASEAIESEFFVRGGAARGYYPQCPTCSKILSCGCELFF